MFWLLLACFGLFGCYAVNLGSLCMLVAMLLVSGLWLFGGGCGVFRLRLLVF